MNLCRIFDGHTRVSVKMLDHPRARKCVRQSEVTGSIHPLSEATASTGLPVFHGGLVFAQHLRQDEHQNVLISINYFILIVVGVGIKTPPYSHVVGQRGLRCASRWLQCSLRSAFD